jgi:hypothetical protein
MYTERIFNNNIRCQVYYSDVFILSFDVVVICAIFILDMLLEDIKLLIANKLDIYYHLPIFPYTPNNYNSHKTKYT